MIDLMLSRDLFLILTRVNEIKKNALKRVHSHQSLSTHYWLAGIWHQISIVLIHYVKSVIRIYMYLLQHTKQMLMFFAILEERYSISIRKRESIEKNCCPFCFFMSCALLKWRRVVGPLYIPQLCPRPGCWYTLLVGDADGAIWPGGAVRGERLFISRWWLVQQPCVVRERLCFGRSFWKYSVEFQTS